MTQPSRTGIDLFWHEAVWASIGTLISLDRLAHALVISGPAGLGKGLFAKGLAQTLLCVNRSANSLEKCGECSNCTGILSGASPDYRALVVEEKKTEISIDQIREFCRWMALSATNGVKVGVITDADRMNRNGYNALLKTLEEPAAGSIIILLSRRPESLPATVLSRCQRYVIPAPEATASQRWMEQQGCNDKSLALAALVAASGAPLAAKELCENGHASRFAEIPQALASLKKGSADPVMLAGQWSQWDQELLWNWLAIWVSMLVGLVAGYGRAPEIHADGLHDLALHCNQEQLLRLYQLCLENRVLQGSTVKSDLLLEDFLVNW